MVIKTISGLIKLYTNHTEAIRNERNELLSIFYLNPSRELRVRRTTLHKIKNNKTEKDCSIAFTDCILASFIRGV